MADSRPNRDAGAPPAGHPAAPAAHLAPPPRIPGYRDIRLHRYGSSAEVYRATSERLKRTVAIKLLRLDDLTTYQQFQQELETAMRLSVQPYVVRILDTGTVDGRPYLVMEFCEDGSYAEIVAGYGPVPVRDAVDVGIKVAEALHAAHQIGVIHRDVTPGNILRSRYGPALADFGIARKPTELSGTVTMNKLTPHHAAPEALRREPQSVASDVYSLGSTLWHLLAGHPPFAQRGERDPDPFSYRERALRQPAPLIPRPEVPVWLQTEIARALAKRPADRHPGAGAFGEALRRGWENWRGEPWQPPAGYPPLGARPGPSDVPAVERPQAEARSLPEWPPVPDAAVAPPEPAVEWPEPAVEWPEPTSATPASPDPTSSQPVSLGPASAHPVSLEPTSAHPTSAPARSGYPGEIPVSAHPGFAPPHPVSASPASAFPALVSPTSAGPATAAPTSGQPVHSHWARPNPADPGPASAPLLPPPPEPPEPGRNRRVLPFIAAGVVGVVLGGVLLGVLGLPDGTGTGPEATPSPAATAEVDTDVAPVDVTIDDRRSSVVISWTDRTGGTAPHYVVGGPKGASPRAITQAEKGVTEVTIDALNPATDYCFTVIAVVSVDEVAPSEEVCTDRG